MNKRQRKKAQKKMWIALLCQKLKMEIQKSNFNDFILIFKKISNRGGK